MNKNKIIIIAIFIIFIIVIGLFSIIISESLKKDNNEQKDSLETKVKDDILLEEVKNPHMYFTVETCINKYLKYISINDKESIYKVLDSNYIKMFNITQENVLEYIEKVDINDFNISISEMYVEEVDDDNQVYYIKGMINNELLEKNEEFCLTVNINIDSQVFSVVPYGYGGVLYEQN